MTPSANAVTSRIGSPVREIRPSLPAAAIFSEHLDTLADTIVRAKASCTAAVANAAAIMAATLRRDGIVLTCGNGGSAAQAQHLAAELVGRMNADRPPLRATALTADAAIVTALGNDYGYDRVFARQVEALGRPGDVLIAFSVSGRSPNVLAALDTANERGLSTILVTGASSTPTKADAVIAIPTPLGSHVQELHLAVVHAISVAVERELFAGLREV